MNVISVKPNPRDPKQGFVRLSDGSEPWTPEIALVEPLVGKPVPEGWLLKDNKAGTGKVLLPPKPKGGAPRYRDSQEAFDREAEGRTRWQHVEEERRDRRTALMQAVASGDSLHGWKLAADEMYVWLRKDSPVAGPAVLEFGEGSTPTKATGETTPEGGRATGQPEVQPPTGSGDPGEDSAPSPGRRKFPMAVAKCGHAYPATEDGRCSGCGIPLEKLES